MDIVTRVDEALDWLRNHGDARREFSRASCETSSASFFGRFEEEPSGSSRHTPSSLWSSCGIQSRPMYLLTMKVEPSVTMQTHDRPAMSHRPSEDSDVQCAPSSRLVLMRP